MKRWLELRVESCSSYVVTNVSTLTTPITTVATETKQRWIAPNTTNSSLVLQIFSNLCSCTNLTPRFRELSMVISQSFTFQFVISCNIVKQMKVWYPFRADVAVFLQDVLSKGTIFLWNHYNFTPTKPVEYQRSTICAQNGSPGQSTSSIICSTFSSVQKVPSSRVKAIPLKRRPIKRAWEGAASLRVS